MFYDNYKANEYDFNECSSKGTCSIAPNVSSIQEIILVLLRGIAHYTQKLKRQNKNLPEIETEILNALSEFISVAEYTDEEVFSALLKLNRDFNTLQQEYKTVCKQESFNCKEYKKFISLDKISGLSSIITMGEKLYLQRIQKLTEEEKFYSDIMLLNLKSLAVNVLKLADYDIVDTEAIEKIINSLNLYNYNKLPIAKLKAAIKDLTATENEILKQRAQIQSETFGEITKTTVSTSTRKNKAVLVSGSSLIDLYKFLEYTKNEENLDVYSHGDLLIAHAFEKFKQFKHFVGNYGNSNENCILDFATFPGAILLTKHSKQNLEHLIRGRIYTMDTVQPKGAIKVTTEDFDKVITGAREAKGFKKGQIRNDVEVGFNQAELEQHIQTLCDKLADKTIQRLLVIGMSAKSTLQEIYLNDVLKYLSNYTYIVSFSKLTTEKEHLEINIANNFPLLYIIMDKLLQKISISNTNLRFYLQKCDPNSISGIIQMKNYGAKKIMLASCSPNIMNPSILAMFAKKYGIDLITSPKLDAETLEE